MATMSSARFRSLYRRRTQAYESVYHFSANSVGHSIAGFSATRTTETSPVASKRNEKYVVVARPESYDTTDPPRVTLRFEWVVGSESRRDIVAVVKTVSVKSVVSNFSPSVPPVGYSGRHKRAVSATKIPNCSSWRLRSGRDCGRDDGDVAGGTVVGW